MALATPSKPSKSWGGISAMSTSRTPPSPSNPASNGARKSPSAPDRSDLTGAEGDFLAPFEAGLLGEGGVLDVDMADMPPQDFDGFDGVASAIEDQDRKSVV